MARPQKLTPDTHAKIVAFIKTGVTNEVAANAAGISDTTFYRWMQEGTDAEPDDPRRQFRESVMRARAERESYLAGLIVQAAPNDWKAAAWLLERGLPDRWGRQTRTEMVGNGGGPIELRAVPAQPVDVRAMEQQRAIMVRAGLLDAAVADELPAYEPPDPNSNGNGNGHHDT